MLSAVGGLESSAVGVWRVKPYESTGSSSEASARVWLSCFLLGWERAFSWIGKQWVEFCHFLVSLYRTSDLAMESVNEPMKRLGRKGWTAFFPHVDFWLVYSMKTVTSHCILVHIMWSCSWGGEISEIEVSACRGNLKKVPPARKPTNLFYYKAKSGHKTVSWNYEFQRKVVCRSELGMVGNAGLAVCPSSVSLYSKTCYSLNKGFSLTPQDALLNGVKVGENLSCSLCRFLTLKAILQGRLKTTTSTYLAKATSSPFNLHSVQECTMSTWNPNIFCVFYIHALYVPIFKCSVSVS